MTKKPSYQTRLLSIILFVFCRFFAAKTNKNFYSEGNKSIYSLYDELITKKELHNKSVQTIKLNPVPQDYPHYNPIWYNNQLPIKSERWAIVPVDIDSTFVLTSHFNITNNFNRMILSIVTLCFAMGVMVSGEPTIFHLF